MFVVVHTTTEKNGNVGIRALHQIIPGDLLDADLASVEIMSRLVGDPQMAGLTRQVMLGRFVSQAGSSILVLQPNEVVLVLRGFDLEYVCRCLADTGGGVKPASEDLNLVEPAQIHLAAQKSDFHLAIQNDETSILFGVAVQRGALPRRNLQVPNTEIFVFVDEVLVAPWFLHHHVRQLAGINAMLRHCCSDFSREVTSLRRMKSHENFVGRPTSTA